MHFDARAEFEAWHFEKLTKERERDLANGRNARKPCAAVLPEEDLNDPGPKEFA